MSVNVLSQAWSEALARERSGDLDGALTGYAHILGAKLEAGEPVPSYLCERLGMVAAALGAPGEAIAIVAAAADKMQRRGDAWGVFRSTLRIAEICLSALDPESAQLFLARVLAGREGSAALAGADASDWLDAIARATWPPRTPAEQNLARVDAFLLLARYYNCVGRFARARAAMRQALADMSGSERVVSRAQVVVLSAEVALQCGDTASVERFLAELHASHKETATALLLRARAAILVGRLSAARAHLGQAFHLVELQQNRRRSRLKFQIVLERVALLARLNRVREAEKVAQTYENELGRDAISIHFRAQLAEALSYVRRKKDATANETRLPFAPVQLDSPAARSGAELQPPEGSAYREQNRSHEPFGDEWAARFNRFLFQLDLGPSGRAEAALLAVERFASVTDSPRLRARTGYARALYEYYRSNFSGAEALLDQCLEAARHMRLLPDQIEAQELLAWVSLKRGKLDRYRELTAQAKAAGDDFLRGLEDEDVVFVRLNRWSQEDQYISERMRSLDDLVPSRFPWLGRWLDRRRDARELLQRFREVDTLVGWRLDDKLRPNRDAAAVLIPSVGEVQGLERLVGVQLALRRKRTQRASLLQQPAPLRAIPAHVAFLYYYVAPNQTFAFLLIRGELSTRKLRVNRIELDGMVRDLIEATLREANSGVASTAVQPLLSGIAARLELEPMLARLPSSIDTLVIVAHDVLVNLPFAALPVAAGTTLLSRFIPIRAPNLDGVELPMLTGVEPAAIGRYIGIAGAAYPGLPPLEQAELELEQALDRLKAHGMTGTILGCEAQPPLDASRLIAELESAQIAHFTCHGKFDTREPHLSSLLVGDARADAALSICEIEQRELAQLRLVLLSSCWAANTATLPGGEQVCLPAAFLRAGARAVIAPLWSVEDAISRKFVSEFVDELGRQPSARALAHVQRRWQCASDAQLFCDWAGYTHYGAA